MQKMEKEASQENTLQPNTNFQMFVNGKPVNFANKQPAQKQQKKVLTEAPPIYFSKTKTQELLEYIPFALQKHKISFLKAFFDDEGSINFRNKARCVRGYQHSRRILEIVQDLLSDLEIESKIDNKNIEVNISGKENLLKFQKIINFTPGLTVNGKRTNSIWKKDLEKRKILEMAINSYLKT